jgi:hypothetical protein
VIADVVVEEAALGEGGSELGEVSGATSSNS